MNKKGQGIEAIMIVFIAVIVGVVLFQAVAQNVGETVNLGYIVNTSLSTVVNGTSQYLTDYRAISDVIVLNETGNIVISSGNYTITNNVVYNGALAVEILPEATEEYISAWQISGTVQPLTYIDDSGGRSMAKLVVIFFALAVAVIGLYPVFKNGFKDLT